MTREEAKNFLLNSIEKEISEHGENGMALMSPRKGKCAWTWREYKEAVINDTDLDECDDSNPIDSVLRLDEYLIKTRGYGLISEN